MVHNIDYTLRVILACMKKDIKSALSERLFLILGVVIPVNFLILMSLFVLAGSHAPTAVVMKDTGPYARRLYQAMAHAHSFSLQQASASQAQQLLQNGQIVAVVTIPEDFDKRVAHNQVIPIHVEINNLNTDFTDDIRRAIPLSITSFYAKAFPHLVTITMHEHDLQRHDTDYIPYIMVSILALSLAVGGILQSGVATAREWEKETIKELLLSPARREAIMLGKMLGSFVTGLLSVAIMLVAIIFVVGIYPLHWGAVIGFSLLGLILFVVAGVLFGILLKHRLPVTALALGISIPLFFLSGAFGPISFSTPIIQVLAQIFPLYYAIVLEQYAFHGFILNAYGISNNAFILGAYTFVLVVIAGIMLRHSTVTH